MLQLEVLLERVGLGEVETVPQERHRVLEPSHFEGQPGLALSVQALHGQTLPAQTRQFCTLLRDSSRRTSSRDLSS